MGLTAVLISACSNRQFAQDTHLVVLTPAPMATVHTPVNVRWAVSGSVSPGTRYAVFTDARPMKPGASLRSLVAGDDPCRRRSDCPDVGWLRAHNIFLTESHEVVLPLLPAVGGVEGRTSPVVHEVLVVPVDESGQREGERVYSVRFRAPVGLSG